MPRISISIPLMSILILSTLTSPRLYGPLSIEGLETLIPCHLCGEDNAQGDAECTQSEGTDDKPNDKPAIPDLAGHGESPTDDVPMPQMTVIDSENLVGCSFLLDEQDDGQFFHAHMHC